jgi:hypothetical protein
MEPARNSEGNVYTEIWVNIFSWVHFQRNACTHDPWLSANIEYEYVSRLPIARLVGPQ